MKRVSVFDILTSIGTYKYNFHIKYNLKDFKRFSKYFYFSSKCISNHYYSYS